ncbi:MAG: UbiD family decarboxylase [Elusimicrobia bacterium]|nr:UbiD family decarboxylase [Elusimicrobiota bacterium]
MSFFSLPQFMGELEKRSLLRRIPVEVSPDLEITEIVDRLYRESDSQSCPVPALLFEKVKGSQFPLLINLLGSEESLEILLGDKPEEIGQRMVHSLEEFPHSLAHGKIGSWIWKERNLLWRSRFMRSVVVSSAPVKEVIKMGDSIDLFEFPIMQSWPLDGGKFVTAGLVITQGPKTGTRNMGIYRLQALNRRELALHWQIQKGGGFHYAESELLDRPLEVAVVIGSDPALWLGGILPLPEGMDEIPVSSFLAGRQIPLVSCETLSLRVPASAEIVIEGIARPKKRALEGPFGDHFGHYSHAAPFPVLEVQCVTHRKGAIYHSAVVGKPPQEDKAMGETVTKLLAPMIRLMRPELTDIWAYFEAGFHNLLVASVRQRYEKEGIKTALALLGEGQMSLSKCVVLVDPEVPVRDFKEVLKAVRAHFDPERDFILLPGTSQDTLDFTGSKMNLGSKMILDATSSGREEVSEKFSSKETPFPDLTQMDSRIVGWRVLEDTLVAVQVDGKGEGEGREILRKILDQLPEGRVKIVAVVSRDVPLEEDTLLLWGIFTRFDCERDLLFSQVSVQGARAVCQGILGIDATWKKGYPLPVEMSAEIKEKVSLRWKEYGF